MNNLFKDNISGMTLVYPDDWTEGIEREYPLLENENGGILFSIRPTESPLNANEMLASFNSNFYEVNEWFEDFIRNGYKMIDYGKATIGSKDAIYVDLLVKDDEGNPDYKAQVINIDHYNYQYSFYIIPYEDYDLFMTEAYDLLKHVVFPE